MLGTPYHASIQKDYDYDTHVLYLPRYWWAERSVEDHQKPRRQKKQKRVDNRLVFLLLLTLCQEVDKTTRQQDDIPIFCTHDTNYEALLSKAINQH
jgi:hypothetical protein